MDPAYERLVRLNDEWTKEGLGRQLNDPGSKYDGGIIDPASGIARANHLGTPSVMAVWACALLHPASSFYRNAQLLQALDRAADFVLNRQHADGTVSLGSTNFNSPPDTAFVVGGLAQVYRLLRRGQLPESEPVAGKLRLFLQRTIPALMTGGCHTPNHRWVITAALALLYELFADPQLLERAEEWLAEGLDITADGEWTERSNGIYNAVSDISLYHTARVLGRPALLDAVRRNLNMMVYLVHPSGEVVTDYSGRQDFGQRADLSGYFLAYRLMAAMDRNPLFAAMADYSAQFIAEPGGVNNNALLGCMTFPELADLSGLERAPLPERYHVTLNGRHPVREHLHLAEGVGHHMRIEHSSMHLAFGAPVVRIREGETSVTIMARTPSFFSLRHKQARLLGVKLATSFSPGIVQFEELSGGPDAGAYRLAIRLAKGYHGPIPRERLSELPELANRAALSPWYLLPHQHRPVTHLQEQRLEAELRREEGSAWRIRIRSDEREDVCAQLTFILGSEGAVTGDDVADIGEGRHMLRSGKALYTAGDSALEIAGGAYEHWLPVLRDDQHPAGCRYVHVNLVTPFDHECTVRLL